MPYTTDEALSEIQKRAKKREREKNGRYARILSCLSGLLFLTLVTVIAVLPGHQGEAPAGSVYGSFLVSMEAGGYILAAVIAFVLGIAITLLCVYLNKLKKAKNEVSENDDQKDQNDQNGGSL